MAADNSTIVTRILLACLLWLPVTALCQRSGQADTLLLRNCYTTALQSSQAYENLRYLTKHIGPRLSGSPQLEKAVTWAYTQLQQAGADTLYLQPVMVPRWLRGRAEAGIQMAAGTLPLAVCALGSSVGTNGTIQAEVMEITSWQQLDSLPAAQIRGKMVFFNRPLNPATTEPFEAYLNAVDQRNNGAAAAAAKGAIATLVRSVTTAQDDAPHTGSVIYRNTVNKIPAAAISTNGADSLHAALQRQPHLQLALTLTCRNEAPVLSYNIIAELKGTDQANEIIGIGAHLDSWDLGEGASDDGTGVVQVTDVLRIIKATVGRPRRTIRVILFTNEENGNSGGLQYAASAKQSGQQHLAMLETDGGGFSPRGFRVNTTSGLFYQLQQWSSLFSTYRAGELRQQQRGVDIMPMAGIARALISLECDDQRFFDIHHAAGDTFEKINQRELQLGAAALAGMALLISEHGLTEPPPFSAFRTAGNTYYLSGQIGKKGTAEDTRSFEEEVAEALNCINNTLQAAGLRRQDVVSVTVYLTDIKHAVLFNKIYQSYFAPPYPARTLVQVSNLASGAKAEITITAVKE